MSRARRFCALALILMLSGPLCGGALADGDPASDVLLGQSVFVPYSPMSAPVQRRLFAFADGAARAGYPLRIAIIASATDLGVVPALFGRPGPYARFLSTELSATVSAPVLVVMPAGFGLAAAGRALSIQAARGVPIGAGADGLGTAALIAGERLAAAAGHPVAAGATAAASSSGASAATVRHALTAILVLVVLGGTGVAAALAARSPSP